MDNLELIDKMDETLANGVEGSRRVHDQIREIVNSYRQAVKQESKNKNKSNG